MRQPPDLKRAIVAIGLTVTLFCNLSSARAAEVSYDQVSKALSNNPGCIDFTWRSGGQALDHGAVVVPVRINGKNLLMQLDTGSQTTQTYGGIAENFRWLKPGQANYFPESLQIANVKLTQPRVQDNKEMSAEGISGTLGLDELLGHVIAINYPAKKFCIFSVADAPPEFDSMNGTHGSISNGKLFLPAKSGTFSSDRMMFDTGSSAMGVVVDLNNWKLLTGLNDPSKAPFKIAGSSWGKKISVRGAYTQAPLSIGKLTLEKGKAFTFPAAPNTFAQWPVATDGVLGNASFENGLVALDLSAQVWFGYIPR